MNRLKLLALVVLSITIMMFTISPAQTIHAAAHSCGETKTFLSWDADFMQLSNSDVYQVVTLHQRWSDHKPAVEIWINTGGKVNYFWEYLPVDLGPIEIYHEVENVLSPDINGDETYTMQEVPKVVYCGGWTLQRYNMETGKPVPNS